MTALASRAASAALQLSRAATQTRAGPHFLYISFLMGWSDCGYYRSVNGTVKLDKEKGAMLGAVCDRRGTGCCHHEVRISKSILKKINKIK